MATILIVDDLSANRESLATILRPEGHRLLEAADGSAGLAAVLAERPDLVITDVLMPVMDGYEFVRQLRVDPKTSGIPVVFYAAHYSAREARAHALSTGVSAVLIKPAEASEVLEIVGRVLSGKSETAAMRSNASPLDHEHLRLGTRELPDEARDLRGANARLRALISIGLELASEPDSDRRLESVCAAARDLFGATYVTLGILDPDSRAVDRVVTCGTDPTSWIRPGDALPGIFEAVVASGRTLSGVNRGARPIGLQPPGLHPEIRAFLVAPIASPTRVYGWICLVGNEGRAFTEEDEELVVALSGQIGRFYELEHEILERKQAEAALRRERDRAQRYLDTADVILLALDLEGRITLINRKGCDLLGWTEPELLGRDWVATCLPNQILEGFRATSRTPHGDRPIGEEPVLTRSGEQRLIEWRNTVLHDDEGRVVGTFSSGADITERNRAIDALRTAEERMRFALEAAGVGIWDMDYTTGKLQWSETIEAHYGLQPGTFGGTFEAFVERVHPDDRESVLDTLGKAVKHGADYSIQNRSIWPDGSARWLSGAGRVQLGEHGQPVRGIGISLDVTERRTLEEQYQQAQKMEAIGRLAGGVAHDFNNLLTAILGYCELVLNDLDPGDPHRKDIGEIQKAGASAARLTRQLLAFSRKQIIEPVLLDLNVVVAGMRVLLGRLIEEDVKVVMSLEPDLAPVKADTGQVEQVVLNLALNARDAMPRGGTLRIETANVDLDESHPNAYVYIKPGAYVVLTVTDTGTGMTPQVQSRLFEPFFTTKELGRGTGLGLATVHGIVQQSGGSVNVFSEMGRGSSFKVYFPRADRPDTVVNGEPPILRPRAGGQTVLVVEDAKGLRELARRLLERQGYTVLVAENADEAIRLFKKHASIDVLLTDVVMPGASGPELTRQLVERRPALKVIYMSGYTEEAIVQHGVLHPGIAFLHKPFTSATLVGKIREVLDGSGPTRATASSAR